MADYYKLVGSTSNRHTDWTSGIVLERDDDGNVTKSVSTTVPAELSAEDVKKVQALGYEVEKTTKKEAEEAQNITVGSDVAGSGPVFTGAGEANQASEEDAKKK